MSELFVRFKRFILLVQTKKVISLNYDSRTSTWKLWRWVRLDVILTMMDIYINSCLDPLENITSSSRSTEFEDILPQNISQTIMKTTSISTRLVISYAMEWGILFWEFDEKSLGTETATWSEFPNEGKSIVEEKLGSEEISKSKRAELWGWQSRIQLGKLTIWLRSFHIEKL